jgi:hypothetical protein
MHNSPGCGKKRAAYKSNPTQEGIYDRLKWCYDVVRCMYGDLELGADGTIYCSSL